MEPQSGKSVVALGLMELLSPRVDRLGFFRPIVPSGDGDPQIDLVRRRYQVEAEPEEMRALTQEEASAIPAYDELRKRVVAEYKAHHRRVWPEVRRSLRRVGVKAMDIYALGRRLTTGRGRVWTWPARS